MTWFKVDDGLHSHPKAMEAGSPAMGLWVMSGSWCADQLTDGFVPAYMAPRLGTVVACERCGATEDGAAQAAKLVTVGLWVPTSRGSKTGWQFHDWEDMQPSRQQVREDRAAQAKRQKDWRERQRAKRDAGSNASRNASRDRVTDTVTDMVTSPVANGAPNARAVPDPTPLRGGEGARGASGRDTPEDLGIRSPKSLPREPEKPREPGTMTRAEAIAYARSQLPPGKPELLTGSFLTQDARRNAETNRRKARSEAPDVDASPETPHRPADNTIED